MVPVLVQDCLPSETYNIKPVSVNRLAPLVTPMMQRTDVTFDTYFVPKRILWENFEDWITNTPDPITGLLPAFPYLFLESDDVPGGDYTKLMDFMGIPTPPGTGSVIEKFNAMPFSAYQMIYNEYYRDQNLITEVIYN